MAHKEGLHGELIAACDPPDQHWSEAISRAAACSRSAAADPVRIKATVMAIFYNHATADQVW